MKEQNNRVNSLSFQESTCHAKLILRWIFWGNYQFKSSHGGAETKQRTLATSSAILINGSNFFMRALNDVTSFCWFDRRSYWSKHQTHWRRGAVVQTFGLAPVNRPQLRTPNLVLFEQIAWLGLDFPSYRPRSDLCLNCQVFSIGMTDQQIYYLPSFAKFEVKADALVRCRSCQGTCPPPEEAIV